MAITPRPTITPGHLPELLLRQLSGAEGGAGQREELTDEGRSESIEEAERLEVEAICTIGPGVRRVLAFAAHRNAIPAGAC